MIYRIPMYGVPCDVCGRDASHVVVRDNRRFIHHMQDHTPNCSVGNELPAPRSEEAAA